MSLIHGGQLIELAKTYDKPISSWLDISTGIAPFSYPPPKIPKKSWRRLPEINENLHNIIRDYYRCEFSAISNGSQAAIMSLPGLWKSKIRKPITVFLPIHGYKEHALAWEKNDCNICWYDDNLPDIKALDADCVLVVINPNNPTGKLFEREVLLEYQTAIERLGGLLIIDEAFMDCVQPSQSMSTHVKLGNTIVLRSFGKFFGLAGVRLGFVIANQDWVTRISEIQGPWTVNGPALFIASKALADKGWQEKQQSRLKRQSKSLCQVMQECFKHDSYHWISGTNLFQTIRFKTSTAAEFWYKSLCERQIYVRIFEDNNALRFGIPNPKELIRLRNALISISKANHISTSK